MSHALLKATYIVPLGWYILLLLLELLPKEKRLFVMDITLKTYVNTKYLILLKTVIVVILAVIAMMMRMVVMVLIIVTICSHDLNSLNVLLCTKHCSRQLNYLLSPFCKTKTYMCYYFTRSTDEKTWAQELNLFQDI